MVLVTLVVLSDELKTVSWILNLEEALYFGSKLNDWTNLSMRMLCRSLKGVADGIGGIRGIR